MLNRAPAVTESLRGDVEGVGREDAGIGVHREQADRRDVVGGWSMKTPVPGHEQVLVDGAELAVAVELGVPVIDADADTQMIVVAENLGRCSVAWAVPPKLLVAVQLRSISPRKAFGGRVSGTG